MTNEERFSAKVSAPDHRGCLIWQGARVAAGYGLFWVGGKTVYAHRFAWELKHSAPGRSHVLHKCDNPPCVNIHHLFLGDAYINQQDSISKGRANRAAAINKAANDRRNAALRIADPLWRMPISEISSDEIAKQAGMSWRSLYRHLGQRTNRPKRPRDHADTV